MAKRVEAAEVEHDNVDDARASLQAMRDAQWKALQEAEKRLKQLDAALASLSVADGIVVRSAEYAGLGIVEAARRYLKSARDGKTTREVLDGIRERGVSTTSRKYIATVYATLNNADRVFYRKDGKWYLKKETK